MDVLHHPLVANETQIDNLVSVYCLTKKSQRRSGDQL